jgi:hypothetical protein
MYSMFVFTKVDGPLFRGVGPRLLPFRPLIEMAPDKMPPPPALQRPLVCIGEYTSLTNGICLKSGDKNEAPQTLFAFVFQLVPIGFFNPQTGLGEVQFCLLCLSQFLF